MGNHHNSDEFNPKDWTKVETDSNLPNLWQNNYNPRIHIEQYLVTFKNQEQLNLQRQFFFERKNHPFWVAAYYFQQQKNNSVCMLDNVAHIYIQKIPIKINNLRQFSLSDLIHIYNQCLQGFKTLTQILGFFEVNTNFIGINERGTVKVWAGSYWQKIGVILNEIRESEMVGSILQSLDIFSLALSNRLQISISNFLLRNTQKLTFNFALEQLRNFALQFNQGIIPNRIQTLNQTQSFDIFFDPLVRSQSHLLKQSKYIPIPQASNSSLYKYRKKDQNNRVKLLDVREQNQSIKKTNFSKNAKTSFNFFTCMNVQQENKPSKIFTTGEMVKHYADFYPIDHLLQGRSKNNLQNRQNTNFNTHFKNNQMKELYFKKPVTNQKRILKQPQIFEDGYCFPVKQQNNNKRYSFQVLKKENQVYCNHSQNKTLAQLHRSDNYAQKIRNKSFEVTSHRQFVRFNPKIRFGLLNNSKNPQVSSQMLPPQKIKKLSDGMNISEKRAKFDYQTDSDRKPLNIFEINIQEPSKFQFTQSFQRNYVDQS